MAGAAARWSHGQGYVVLVSVLLQRRRIRAAMKTVRGAFNQVHRRPLWRPISAGFAVVTGLLLIGWPVNGGPMAPTIIHSRPIPQRMHFPPQVICRSLWLELRPSAYALAAFVGYSRVESRQHHWGPCYRRSSNRQERERIDHRSVATTTRSRPILDLRGAR